MKQSLALLKQLEDEIAALPSASTIKKPMISEAAEESQILEELKREYYGVEIKFSETEFYVVDSYQLLEACQGTLLLTDMFRPKLEFYQADYPIKNMSIIDWLDLHVIFTSANEGEKTGAKKLPAIILDCGGRKIRLPVGGNRYSYDMGKLPSYELKYIQGKAHIYTDTTNQENVEVLRNINKFGKDPLEQSLKYISYPDIIKQMKKHYGDYYSSTSIAKEIRRLLKGAPLSDGHSPYLPVLTCALFASEVARNPICMVSGLMLLDLIEIQAKTPNGTDYFRWDNVLESPAFHPMVHHGSWSDEFKKGKYYIEKPLNLSHIKSFIILAEWAKRYFSTMKISVLNEETYKARYSKGLQAHIDYYSQYGRKHEKMWQYEYQRCTSGAIASFFTSINASLNARFQDIRNPLKPENNFPFDRLFPSSLGSVSNSNGQNAVAGLSTANEVDEKCSREVTIYTRQANSSLTLP
ncbi:MAG TPA: hypothetical protein PLL67_05335, partial [Gammaproteobacteria bacterium]|nr:hypothetical protein [Gammaproteobacteria bacterium]